MTSEEGGTGTDWLKVRTYSREMQGKYCRSRGYRPAMVESQNQKKEGSPLEIESGYGGGKRRPTYIRSAREESEQQRMGEQTKKKMGPGETFRWGDLRMNKLRVPEAGKLLNF